MPRPVGGYRLKDGTKVPGTTTITGRFKDSGGLMFWAFEQGKSGADTLYEKRDEAGDVGTYAHLWWESILSGKPAPTVPQTFISEQVEQATRCVEAAVRWYEDTGLKITPMETPLVSEIYRFGGTPDGHGFGKRGGAVVDWKTGKDIYPDTWMQVAAYRQLITENRPDLDISDGIHVVRFGKAGGEFSHLHVTLGHPGLILAWEQFQALIGCYERDKRLKKLT
jgi:hypothetical protein